MSDLNMSDPNILQVNTMEKRNTGDGIDKVNCSPIRLTKSHNISGQGSMMNRMQSEELLHETKYVMLNFMSLVPKKLYKDHVFPSPDLMAQGPVINDKFSKSMSHLSKSKSFDVASSKSHRQAHLLRMHRMEKEDGSPASEDNVNYRYKLNQAGLNETQGTSSTYPVKSETDFHSEYVTKSQSVNSVEASSSSSETSPRKTPTSINRLYSDTSSVDSYYSDADDEYEVSHSSSRFSAASLSQHDGFLDLRKPLKHKMARSVSDYDTIDQVTNVCPDTIPECQDEDEDIKTGTRESSYIVSSQGMSQDNGDYGLDEADGFSFPLPFKSTMDRSKLKLNIPPQPVMLDDVMLSFQSELNSELSEMSEHEEAVKSARESTQRNPCLTPTQAAKILAEIGDEVANEYSYQISNTISQLFFHRVGDLTYQQFKDISTVMIDHKLPGWRQVALLMVYGQGAAWYAVQGGHKNIGGIIDHCSRFVFDVAAEFIIKEGGWGAVMNFDPSQSSDTQSSDFESPMADFFTSHNVTQVESGSTNEIDDASIPTSRDANVRENSPFQDTQHSVPEIDFFVIPETESDQSLVDVANHSSLFVSVEQSHIYKPSLGFDFRTVSTASDGTSVQNPSSDTSLDQFEEGQKNTESNEEEVFDVDQNSNNNEHNDKRKVEVFDEGVGVVKDTSVIIKPRTEHHVHDNINDSKDNSKPLGTSSSIAHHFIGTGPQLEGDQVDGEPESVDTHRSTAQNVEELNDLNKANQNDDGLKTVDESAEQMHCGVDGKLTKEREAIKKQIDQTNKQPAQVGEATKEQEDQTNNPNESGSVIEYLGGPRAKLVLFAGAAAAVGLGLKFGFFNR